MKMLGKQGRRHKQEQLRKAAKEMIAAKKKAVGHHGAPPVLVGVVALAASQGESVSLLVKRISSCMSDVDLLQTREGLLH